MNEIQIPSAKLVGGRFFLDLINTISYRGSVSPVDKLLNFNSLLGWCCEVGISDETEANHFLADSDLSEHESWLRRAIKFRESLYNISVSIIEKNILLSDDLNLLNREFRKGISNRCLSVHGDIFVWSWSQENLIERIFRTITDSAVQFFIEGDLSRIRKCGGENCGWIFEDTTRNRSRTWCDMKDCGNLAKIRRFRQKKTN